MGFGRGSLAIAGMLLCACGDNIHFSSGDLIVSPQIDLRTTESGGSAMFTVALGSEPATDIVVELTSMDMTEGMVSPSTLTFRRSDHDQPQTVTIIGIDDDRVDGDKEYTVRVATPSADAALLEVTNQDDDMAGFTVSPLFGLMTNEGGTTAQFEVTILSEPLADVTVPLTSSDPSEGMPDVSMLTFTGDNWLEPQLVTVTGQQDALADGSVSYVVLLGPATSADDVYQGIDPDDVSVLNVDDDIHGIAVSAPNVLVTNESGTIDTFTVVLQTQPTADVTIDVVSTVGAEATVAPAQLVFTPSNWDQPQTVTVTGANDFIDDGDQAFVVTLGSASSTDGMYDGLDPDDIPGTNQDNDTAGIVVTPTAGLVTSEAGGGAAFDVVLGSQPLANVTIAVTSSDPSEGQVMPTMLTFSAATWNVPRTVNVVGLNDPVSDGNQTYTIVLSAAVSADPLYSGLNPDDVSVTNLDNDTTSVTVDPINGLFVSEFADTDTFTIVLDTAPTAAVTITLTSSDPSEGVVSPNSVTFMPGNWNQPRTITVTGRNDNLTDGNIVFTIITGAATSQDPRYNGLAVPDVEVTNVDNETPQVYVKARKLLRVSESGQSTTFRVRLTMAPTAPVTCTLHTTDTSEGLASPQTLVFQPTQFGFQTVTVSGVDDQLVDGDVPFTVVLDACTSMDTRYNGQNPRDVAVINRDND